MDKYTNLLRKAVNEMVTVFRKKTHVRLLTDRGAKLIAKAKQINEMKDFELVTWLIVK